MRRSDSYSEFKDDIISSDRVSTVVKGGRRFSCATLAVAGDGKSRVGYGTGKDLEAFGARQKAVREARRNARKVPLRSGVTLHSEVRAKFGASRVRLAPASRGSGIKSSNTIRPIFELIGVKDIVVKRYGTTNSKNITRAIFAAFDTYQSPQYVARKRRKKINEIVRNKKLDAHSV